jgi:Protein ENHANCED DISEASE RESISTANCE 2, C-terminal
VRITQLPKEGWQERLGSPELRAPPIPPAVDLLRRQSPRRPVNSPHFTSTVNEAMDPPSNPRNHQIRHSGQALIRGKIRRVWRPRYLELWDNGVVRYYELPPVLPSAFPLLSPNQRAPSAKEVDDPNKKLLDEIGDDDDAAQLLLRRIPRYTLRVYSARILDATTLRDMHVGLPQGSFGFVFRGQRLMHLEDQSSEHGWNDADEQEGGRTILGSSFVSSSPSTVPLSSLLMNPTQCTPQPQEQRDFLCAVSTLEEAQMWVIALQWAALQSSSSVEPIDGASDEPWWSVENEEWVGTTTPTLEVSASTTDFSFPGSTSKRAADESSKAGTEVAASPYRPPPTKPGKVVVARVVDYRLVRVPSSRNSALPSMLSLPFPWFGPNFDIAFEIHTLLIQDQVVEQLKLLRTSHDLSMLLQALPFSPPRLVRMCQQLPRNGQDLEKNVSIVDSIVRSLVLDAAIVNSSAMKQFLGLSASGVKSIGLNVDSDPPFWFMHDSRAVLRRTTTELTESAEDYVRRWLQERNRKRTTSDSWALRLYQHACSVRPNQISQRQIVFTATALGISALVVPYCAVQVWRVMPRFSVRLDVLVGSWVTAAYLGRRYEQQQQSSALPMPLPHRRRERHAHAELLRRSDDTEYAAAENVTAKEHYTSQSTNDDEGDESDGEEPAIDEDYDDKGSQLGRLSSPLPEYPSNQGQSCWSIPPSDIFYVRGPNYLEDKLKIPSDPGPLTCRGVDVWLTDNPVRHIARHPSILGGKLKDQGTFLVNFLLPFGNFVSYFSIPPLDEFPSKLRAVWTGFLSGDQQYRDARLKLLPVVIDGPWIVKTAVGGGKSPALLGKVIPLQYYFRDPDEHSKGVYEVDVIITASKIAKGILSVVKGHTKSVSIAFALIIEASQADDLPETVLCSFQVHSLHLEDCPLLPDCDLEDDSGL